jgi:RHS repeat-associated protein
VAGFATSRDGVPLTYEATGAIASIGTVAAFDHDLDGRPVSRTLNGVTKNFRFGGAIAYSTAGTPIEADLGDVVIKLDGGTNRYRHTDFRGNVLFQTNAAGAVTGQAVYRGFGRFMVDGNLGERGFAGGFEIPSLGLVVLGPRVLDSDTGRFLSQDPVFNAVNQYAYTQGNPVFLWDPAGRSDFGIARASSFSFSFGAALESPSVVVYYDPQAALLGRAAVRNEWGWGAQFGMSGVGLNVIGFDVTVSIDFQHGTSLTTRSGAGDIVGGEVDADIGLFIVKSGLPALLKAIIIDINKGGVPSTSC